MDDLRPPKLEVYRDDNVAQNYDQRWAGAIGAKRDRRKARAIRQAFSVLVNHYSNDSFTTVLDIPCGTGRFSDLFDDQHCLTVGADLSFEMLQQAQLKHPQHQFVCADLGKLPFDDKSIDVGMCIRMLHLVHSSKLRISFLRELKRVCKFGAIIDYRHSHTIRILSRRLRYRLGIYNELPSNPSPQQILHELQQAGFTPLAKINVHFAPFLSDKLIFPVIPSGN
ncbi:MAG: class I SAM-dependent methyltransferase [Planctomycetes bacterium]|nr:class I SAM-dependent methyltransferase [Planctomycetota bacterium]